MNNFKTLTWNPFSFFESPMHAMTQLARLGSKIPPTFNFPILTSSVQVTCLIGICVSFQAQRYVSGTLTHLRRKDYAQSQYKILRVAQRCFDHSRVARIVARCLFRYPLIPNLFLFPLLTTLLINEPYICPRFFCASKAAGLISIAFIILSQEFIRGDNHS